MSGGTSSSESSQSRLPSFVSSWNSLKWASLAYLYAKHLETWIELLGVRTGSDMSYMRYKMQNLVLIYWSTNRAQVLSSCWPDMSQQRLAMGLDLQLNRALGLFLLKALEYWLGSLNSVYVAILEGRGWVRKCGNWELILCWYILLTEPMGNLAHCTGREFGCSSLAGDQALLGDISLNVLLEQICCQVSVCLNFGWSSWLAEQRQNAVQAVPCGQLWSSVIFATDVWALWARVSPLTQQCIPLLAGLSQIIKLFQVL